ncbi:MAG: hypothetical protein LQ343_004799 [Gyalolechia ehrenbergii]|nr:MAG: hypothetical protein LQ343_004799 [Gyalolechia ehrenbergii]
MESQSTIDIIVFPERDESEGSDGAVTAQADKSLPYSIISTGMLSRVGVGFIPCQMREVKDAKNMTHSPIGKVDLRWHKKEKGKSHPQTFYVVDRATPLVLLGAPAFVTGNQYSGEEQLAMERKKQEAAERRALESKEQEKIEAERRQQQSQKK